jgi:hypothetical protein
MLVLHVGAVEKTRTSTAFRPQRPQRCASTSSATTARHERVGPAGRRHWQGAAPSKADFSAQWRRPRSDHVHNGTILKRPFTIMNEQRYALHHALACSRRRVRRHTAACGRAVARFRRGNCHGEDHFRGSPQARFADQPRCPARPRQRCDRRRQPAACASHRIRVSSAGSAAEGDRQLVPARRNIDFSAVEACARARRQ